MNAEDAREPGPAGPAGVEALIGRNLARMRGRTSQKELAERMRTAGHKWSQTTVWNVEHGARPVRLAEAASLSEILQVPLTRFLVSEEPDDVGGRLIAAARRRAGVLSVLADTLEGAAGALEQWRDAVAQYEAVHGRERLSIAVADATSTPSGSDWDAAEIDRFTEVLRALVSHPSGIEDSGARSGGSSDG